MTSQPGWHPDPVPPQPGQPAQLRYWDGTRWTEHTSPVPPPVAGTDVGAPPAYQGQYGAAPAYQEQYAAAYPYATDRATTPDGVPLAGWWWRVLAVVLDSLILGVVATIVAFPWVRDLYDSYRDWFDEALNDTSGTMDTSQLQSDVARPLAVITVIQLGLGFVYHVGFLMWKQATPGKLAVGLRVRLRERPGPMPFGTVLVRWAGQYGVGIIGMLPVLGFLTIIYRLLDYLWPLWDPHKQAVHDKIAKTNVVRIP